MMTANWRSRSSSGIVLSGAKACVSASVLPTATTTRRPDVRKPSTALSRAAMRWRMLRSSSWSTARQPSHSSAPASGSTISTINVSSVTWKGMERRDPFISPRVDDGTCLLLLGHPFAAEALLGDGERIRRHGEIGDKEKVEPAELIVGLVDVGPHHLHRLLDTARRGDLGLAVLQGEGVLAGELRIRRNASLDVAGLGGQPEIDRLRGSDRRQQRRQHAAGKAIDDVHGCFLQ